MSYPDFPKKKRQPNNNVGCAVVLLLPLILMLVIIQLQPAIETFLTSLTDYSLVRDSQFIGLENYSRLFSDARVSDAVRYTLYIVIERVAVLAFVPVFIGWLIGQQGRFGRILNRTVLGVLAAFISPMALIVLWRALWSPMWGRERTPISSDLLQLMMPNRPESAIRTTLLLDALLTLAIALIIGSIVYVAVLRGRETHAPLAKKVGISVWIGSVLYAIVSALHAYLLPFVLTRGGPANATTSFYYYAYDQGFRAFRLGASAAQAVILMIPAIISVCIVWYLITKYRIRIQAVRDAVDTPRSSLLSLISLPIIALIFIPIVGLVIWGYSIGTSGEGISAIRWSNTTANISFPIVAIWFFQIPISYAAGAGLGLIRPFNRRVTNLLFLVLLIIAFLPAEALMFQWFINAADAELINQRAGQAIPWLTSGIAFLIFKLFFDGKYDEFQSAREGGQSTNEIVGRIVVTSLPLVLIVGCAITFVSIQSLLWNLLVAFSPENFAPAVRLLNLSGDAGTQTHSLLITAVQFVQMFFLPFGLAFAVLCGFGLEKFAIVGGDADGFEPTPFSDLLGHHDEGEVAYYSTDDADLFSDDNPN